MKKKRTSMRWMVVGAIIVVGLIACLIWYRNAIASMDPNQQDAFVATTTPISLTASPNSAVTTRTAPPGTKEFRNDVYHFSFFYPDSLSVHTYDEGGGAITITFQNVEDAQGFQIFVVPYRGSSISEAQFRKDVPSGVRNDVLNIMIDGALGASFYGENALLGETAEVWFIHGGYLYEITTLKPLAPWLSDIIQTWKFL